MKIGIVCYPTYGGSGIIATELGIELARHNIEVHFISYALPTRLNKYEDNIFFHKVEFPHYPLFEFHLYSLALAGKIIDVVNYEKLDILHVHYAIPHTVSGFLAKQIVNKDNNFKLITTLHGTDITLVGLEPTFFPLVKFSLNNSDAITAVSNYLKEKTNQIFKPEVEIEVIPNFVDTEVYKNSYNETIKKHFAPNNEKILIHISNFRSVKRVPDLIKVVEKVSQTHNVKLLLIGDGPERNECERLTREKGLTDKIKFLGLQTSFVELLSISDIFLLPSQSESFGLAALEAMSCGVPVIGTNIGGIPEVIIHNETGYLVELGDIDQMSRYVIELLDNTKKWQTFSENSRKIVEEKYSKSIIFEKYLKLYNKLMDLR